MTGYQAFLHIARWEGLSCIVLFFVAMPLKYLADMPEVVTQVGRIHGGLFCLYIAIFNLG